MDIFAEMLDSTGTTRTVELFRVNNTTSGEQVAPNCFAVPNSHKLLVSWYNVQSGSASQIALIDMDNQRNVSGDQIVSNAAPNTVINQSILVDATGSHGQVLYIEGGDIWSRAFDINGNSLTMGETTNLTSSLHWQSGVNFVRASSVLGTDGQQYIALVGNDSTTEKVFVLKTQMTGQAEIASSLEVYSGLKNDGLTPRVDINLADGQLVVSWLTTDGIGIASIDTNVANVNDLPTGSVTISGTATQGQVLTASNTLADLDGLGAISYQWLSDGSVISGATESTYTLTQAEVGKPISVKASYTDLLGAAESKTSTSTSSVANVNDLPTGSVTISGTATQGQVLTASNTLADLDGLGTISYQWLSDGSVISGATGSTYTLTQAEVEKTISVKGGYTDLLGTSESVTSSSTTSVANVNDLPTGNVTITGTAAQGQVLTASNTLADLDGLGTISYQWLSDGSVISGATGSTYTLTQAEVGKTISVKASYTDLLGTAESVTSSSTASVANVNDLPTGSVTITGTAAQGQVLTASNTLADLDGLGTISYQWLSDGSVISGATGSTYTLTQSEVGKTISVKASYTDLLGTSESVTSSSTTSVANVNDLPTGNVTITGTAAQGQVLTASNTLTDLDGLGTISYQWLSNGTVISGATGSTYTLTQSEVGKTISVKASYTDLLGTSESVISSSTTSVANVNDLPTGNVTISGTATQGQVLTASNTLTDLDGLGTISYQWLSDGSAISGATGSTYTLTQAEVGKTVSVKANYTDLLGTAESVVSLKTSAVTSMGTQPTTITKVPMVSGANFTAVSDAAFYGNSGFETVKIQDGVAVTLDGNIERVEFARPSSSYTYQATPTGIDVLLGGIRAASVVNGEKLAFTNGSAMVAVTFTPQGLGFTLGGSTVSTTASAIAFTPNNSIGEASTLIAATPVSVTLNANSTSVTATSSADIFNIASGSYKATIADFKPGDKLKFFAGASIFFIQDNNQGDGYQEISGTDPNTGATAIIALTGLTSAQDDGAFNVASFNTAFGAGSLV
jgi:hypothetical protein